MPWVRDSFQGSRFDHGYHELYPSFRRLDSGKAVVRAHKSPPARAHVPPEAESTAAA